MKYWTWLWQNGEENGEEEERGVGRGVFESHGGVWIGNERCGGVWEEKRRKI